MTIYISHSRNFDYQKELYQILQNSSLVQKHNLIFPHQNSSEPYPTKDLILNHKCDLVLAEVSFPATGQGIELGWADVASTPIICIYKKDHKIAGSLKVISNNFLEYSNLDSVVEDIDNLIDVNSQK
jgi:hypothetical protein